MRRGQWNTGRQYSLGGQRIVWTLEGRTVLFSDIDRHISGRIDLVEPTDVELEFCGEYEARSDDELQAEILSYYDAGSYEWDRDAHDLTWQEPDRAATVIAELRATDPDSLPSGDARHPEIAERDVGSILASKPGTTGTRALCAVCDRSIAVTKNGYFHRHNFAGHLGASQCPGTRHAPLDAIDIAINFFGERVREINLVIFRWHLQVAVARQDAVRRAVGAEETP